MTGYEIDEFIPFHRPSLGSRERVAVMEVLDSGWLTTGERTRVFEQRFAAYVGTSHAVAVNSATAALHLAFEGLGVTEASEVVVPTYTFAASAETVLYLRARPVLVDVDERTLNVHPAAVEAAITSRTAAVEVVHLAGLPAELPGIFQAIDAAAARLHRAPPAVVEDAAHAFPTPIGSLGGRLAGTIGKVGAYSFYATKTMTTGEGGMFVTEDGALADRARTMRLHGISRDAWSRYTASGAWYYEIEAAGYKDNPTDLASALGLVQLDRAEALKEARTAIATRYLDALGDVATAGRIQLPAPGGPGEHAWHLFVLRLTDAQRGGIDDALPGVSRLPQSLKPMASRRARAIELLLAGGIGVSVHFIPLHLHPLYRTMGYGPGDFPAAERAYAGAISLPIWPGMSEAQVDRVIAAVRAVI